MKGSKFKIGDKVMRKNKIYTIENVLYSQRSKRYYYLLQEDNVNFWYEEQLKEVTNEETN